MVCRCKNDLGKLAALKRSEVDFPVLKVFFLGVIKLVNNGYFQKKSILLSVLNSGIPKVNRHPTGACFTLCVNFIN
jgi:hypothetical protein